MRNLVLSVKWDLLFTAWRNNMVGTLRRGKQTRLVVVRRGAVEIAGGGDFARLGATTDKLGMPDATTMHLHSPSTER